MNNSRRAQYLPKRLASTAMLSGLLLVGAGLTASSPAAAGPPPFTSTTLVGCTGNAINDGANLLAAVAAATAPALVKLEPCLYNLNGGQLVMRNLVDVAGSGRDVTTIFSSAAATVQVPSGVEAELRQVTVSNGAADNGIGVNILSNRFLLTQMNVEVRVGRTGTGVQTVNSSPRLNEVFARVAAERTAYGVRILGGGTVVTESFVAVQSNGVSNIGWDLSGGTNAVLDRAAALVSGSPNNTAVLVRSRSAVTMNNVRGTVIGGSSQTQGLRVARESSATVKESTFSASGDAFVVALGIGDSSSVNATESTFRANPLVDDTVNVFAVRLTGSANLDTNQSNYESSSFAAQNLGSGTARFGASQLIGSVLSSSATGLQCIFAYNGSYNARTATCS